MPKQTYQNVHHIPVLLNAVIESLKPAHGESYLDVTAGMGGHATVVIAATHAPEKAVLVDRDPQAIDVLKGRFPKSTILGRDFLSASQQLKQTGQRFDMILADLGVSSQHFDQASRGFSFRQSGPLDMRMDPEQELTAEHIVNNWSADDLAQLFRDYGEEPKAKPAAQAVGAARPIVDTAALAAAVSAVLPRTSKIHPATKVFQALRIAVNDELGQLENSLPLWLDLLNESGRIAIISFHSLEDRIVKRFFAEHAKHPYEAELKLLTKKPLMASKSEIAINPRARSAKLRAAAKIKTERKI